MNTATNEIPGAICYYKGKTHFVVETVEDNKLKILNPSDNRKLVVRADNPELKVTANRLSTVDHKGDWYLADPAGLIISLKTHKIMQWGKENGNRIAIMAMVRGKTVKPTASKPVSPLPELVENDPELADDWPF